MFKLNAIITPSLSKFLVVFLLTIGCDSHDHPKEDHQMIGEENAASKIDKSSSESSSESNKENTSRKPTLEQYYTCSMHPHVKEDHPGKCPICSMNLTKIVKEHIEDTTATAESEEIAEYQCQDLPSITSDKPGVCPVDGTQMIKKSLSSLSSTPLASVTLRRSQLTHFNPGVFIATTMKMEKNLRVLGTVKSAEEKASNIAARFPARVEKVFVESVGSQIKKGDPVVEVYSPELLTTGEELILSASQASGPSGDFTQLYKKAREKLLLWGIKSSQIDQWVKNKRMPRNVILFANSSGVVRNRNAVTGKYFKEGQNYFELSDLSQVWIEMDVYEHDSNLIKPGQNVSLKFVAVAGEPKFGKINFISPTIDEKTRTLKVRTTISNTDGTLKPGMVAQGTIVVSLETTPVVLPTSAIIDTGIRKIVWLKVSNTKFSAKQVTTGFQSDGYTEIIDGIKEGDSVITEGNFMLDAQAQFFGAYEASQPKAVAQPKTDAQPKAIEHNHP